MEKYEAVCAGHICVDMSPVFDNEDLTIENVFVPGRLSVTGEMALGTGGSVSNTGVALSRLGVNTRLIAKVGDDRLGAMIKDMLRGDCGIEGIHEAKGEHTSYTVVLALPGADRILLHNPSVNDTFCVRDVDMDAVSEARLFHFGYPTLIRSMYSDGGRELESMLKAAKQTGVTTSLDMTLPDPDSPAGKVDWKEILYRAAPYMDIFLPSAEEIMYMLDRDMYRSLKMRAGKGDVTRHIDLDELPKLGDMLIDMGVKIAVIKCGVRGLYVKTAGREKLGGIGKAAPADIDAWAGREYFSGVYQVDNVKSALGAGDSSIAGFLAALLRGAGLKTAVSAACAAGALCVQTYSAADGILPYEEMLRVFADKKKTAPEYNGAYWRPDEESGMLVRA